MFIVSAALHQRQRARLVPAEAARHQQRHQRAVHRMRQRVDRQALRVLPHGEVDRDVRVAQRQRDDVLRQFVDALAETGLGLDAAQHAVELPQHLLPLAEQARRAPRLRLGARGGGTHLLDVDARAALEQRGELRLAGDRPGRAPAAACPARRARPRAGARRAAPGLARACSSCMPRPSCRDAAVCELRTFIAIGDCRQQRRHRDHVARVRHASVLQTWRTPAARQPLDRIAARTGRASPPRRSRRRRARAAPSPPAPACGRCWPRRRSARPRGRCTRSPGSSTTTSRSPRRVLRQTHAVQPGRLAPPRAPTARPPRPARPAAAALGRPLRGDPAAEQRRRAERHAARAGHHLVERGDAVQVRVDRDHARRTARRGSRRRCAG